MTVARRGRKNEFGSGPDFRPAHLPGAAGAAWLCAVKRDSGNELLKGVSRSFYLSLRLLPEPMRGAASLGYLLARSSDTLADTPGTPVEARLLCLDWFARSLAGEEEIPRWPLSMLNAVSDARERQLLEESGRLLAWLEKLPAAEAALVREVVLVIIGGQQLDLERFGSAEAWNPVALQNDAELDDYTWRVAGCVGAFWTRLGFLTMGDRFSKAPAELLLDMGISYGKGLQLVNILRDLPGDLKQGRCYLPVSDPDDTCALLEAHGRWLETALERVADGFAYSAELRSRKLRAASLLPAMIARDTLLKMRGVDWPILEAGVKVSRANVYRSLIKAFASSGPR
jgi:farnesyl-diphosphate farnesyltransferase